MPLPVPAKTRQRLALLCCLPLVFSLVFFGVELLSERTDIRLLEVQNLKTSISELRNLAKDAESSERGFLLTGDSRYLKPLNQAEALLPSRIKICQASVRSRYDLLPKINSFAALVQTRFALASHLLAEQREKGFEAAVELEKTGDPELVMRQLQTAAADLLKDVNVIEQHNLDRERELNRWTFIFFSVGTMVMITTMVWLYNALLSYLYARDDAREQLQKVNSELQNRIDNRTRELEEMNSELQQFAYVASHDLQEPLRTITSFSQLLESRYRGSLDADADEFIGYIVTASRRMTDLINGLLQLVRLRKTSQTVAPVSFERLLADAEASLQASIRESGAQIEHGPLPSLVVDSVQFSQVLQNLISNAIRHTSAKGIVTVSLRRERITASGENVIVEFSDTGCGIRPDQIAHIFEPGFSGTGDTSGLGLAVCDRIMKQHGGSISASNGIHSGARFTLLFPVLQTELATA